MDRMRYEAPDLTVESIAKLSALFPGVVADSKASVDLLRLYVGEVI